MDDMSTILITIVSILLGGFIGLILTMLYTINEKLSQIKTDIVEIKANYLAYHEKRNQKR